MKQLDESIIGIVLDDPGYLRYLNTWWILVNVATANQKVRSVFTPNDTPRSVWNTLMFQKPRCCGKIHELEGSKITAGQCKKQDNPLCWHPEETQFFHGLWVANYLASQIDRKLPHPGAILSPLMHIDFAAQVSYWTDIFSTLCWNPGGAIGLLEEGEIDEQTVYELTERIPVNIARVKRTLKEREKRLWKEVIRPHMMQVSAILRKVA
jgi:hypothetical protein